MGETTEIELRDGKLYVEGIDQPYVKIWQKFPESLPGHSLSLIVRDLRYIQRHSAHTREEDGSVRPTEFNSRFQGNASIGKDDPLDNIGLAILGERQAKPAVDLAIEIGFFDQSVGQDSPVKPDLLAGSFSSRSEICWPAVIEPGWSANVSIPRKVFDALLTSYRTGLQTVKVKLKADMWVSEEELSPYSPRSTLYLQPDRGDYSPSPALSYVTDFYWEERSVQCGITGKSVEAEEARASEQARMRALRELTWCVMSVFWAVIGVGVALWLKK